MDQYISVVLKKKQNEMPQPKKKKKEKCPRRIALIMLKNNLHWL